jgi:hypothetical protein
MDSSAAKKPENLSAKMFSRLNSGSFSSLLVPLFGFVIAMGEY